LPLVAIETPNAPPVPPAPTLKEYGVAKFTFVEPVK
jgi:hypothetical protein